MGSNVYATLLDASRAFDRVEYMRLLNVFLSKGICPVVAKFLVVMYSNRGNCLISKYDILSGHKTF